MKRSRHAVTLVAAFLIPTACGLTLLVPNPVRSQDVALVKVDVAVVGRGYRVSKLQGHTVVNDKNESVGKIDDLVIGRDQGNPLFAILQVGGFLGIGSRLVAVPYKSLVIDDTASKVELPGASRDALEQLARFQYTS